MTLLSNNKWKTEWITESLLSQGDDCNNYFHWNTSPWVVGCQKSSCRIAEHLEHWVSETGILKTDGSKIASNFKQRVQNGPHFSPYVYLV